MKELVIIGGSAEARELAERFPKAQVRLPVPERVAAQWPGRVSHGAVTAEWLRSQGARCLVEAAHPCDSQTAWQVARVCAELGLPQLQLVRPAWRAARRDLWNDLRSLEDLRHVVPQGARVLVTTGRALLPQLRGLRAHVLARRIGQGWAPFPLRQGHFLYGQGPFSVAHEVRLLRKERIDWLVMRNAGGAGGWPKLAAARQLGVPVAMVRRPARPDGPMACSVSEATAWVAAWTNG